MTQLPDVEVTAARPQNNTARLSRLAAGVSVILAACVSLTFVLVLLTRSAQRPEWHPWVLALSDPLMIAAFAAPGAVVAVRRSHNPVGWLLLATGCGMAVDNLARAYGLYALQHHLPGALLAVWMSTWAFVLVSYPIFFLLLLFPNGRQPSTTWRAAAWYTGMCAAIAFLVAAFMPGPPSDGYFPSSDNPLGVSALSFMRDLTGLVTIPLTLIPFLLSAASLIYRFRTSRRPVREQLKWVALSLWAAVALIGATLTVHGPLASIATGMATVIFSTGVMIAIVRHHLFDIDRLLSRSLLYTALTASAIGLYAGIVSLLGLFIQGSVHGTASLLATGLVAVALQPLHRSLQRLISRLIYGLRDDPYTALATLGRQMEESTAPEQILPMAAVTLGEALRLSYVAIHLHSDTDGPTLSTARWGAEARDPLRLPLIHQGVEVGSLVVGARSPEEPFTAADLRLLRDAARHIAQAAAGVQLTLALLRSRQQLIATRAQERRRLGRQLHDGVNSALSEVVWGLQAARKWHRTDPERADALLDAGITRARQGIETVRGMSRGLRSPLDGIGLLEAIRIQIERFPLPVTADLPDELPELPAAVEEAAYWIVVEAMTNVLRHAQASRCELRLSIDEDALTVEVADDGRGLPTPLRLGVGVGSMRERAAEIGGTFQIRHRPDNGTEVVAYLPLTLPGIDTGGRRTPRSRP
ncbi:sensor histidine kinase [Streptomyces echinatus]|uniref:Signal transduction histidine kinase n=1 Tax=Streptomyces echinatus TaxID=67293 RepID=A0A7W9Q217_9ACTN|nr:sensor histidine kinase [Streptomyces echinatus]MBB5932168.1 signal transduction histidine kinase [Streptomyces echinatus]